MNNMCIFLSAMLSALTVGTAWTVGYFLLLSDEDSSKSGLGVAPVRDWGTLDGKPDLLLGLLREAVRLAEERMKAQDSGTQILQGKAALMGTLCLLTVGYLLSVDFSSPVSRLLALFAVSFLILAVAYCAKAINFAKHGQLGMHPTVFKDIFKNVDENSMRNMLCGVLKQYYNRIDQNEKTNGDKRRDLHSAKRWWLIGTGLALGAVAGEGARSLCTYGWLVS